MTEDLRDPVAPGRAALASAHPTSDLTASPIVYFHIGAPKTGTTFLQRVLWTNRERLAELGVLYPGQTFRSHLHAAFDLRGAGFQGHRDPKVPGAWSALVESARGWNGPVVFSQGLFSPATRRQIDRAMEDLAFAEVHIVCTARELTRQVPAAWQEDIKNRFRVTFDEYVAALQRPGEDDNRLGRMFWRMQDLVELLDRWSRNLPAERVHIVTVPPSGRQPDVLWRRFAQVIGVDPEAVHLPPALVNRSLGASEATFLLRLNDALDAEVGWPLYNEMVKQHVQDALVQRTPSARAALSAPHATWFVTRGLELVDELRTRRYELVGSLDDLMPPPLDSFAADPPAPTADEQLAVAVEAMAAILLGISRRRRKARAS